MSKSNLLKIIGMVLGNTLVGLSNGILRKLDLGMDPFSTFVQGFSLTFNIQFGLIQMLISIIVFSIQFLFVRKTIGIGTLYNVIFMGFTSDFMMWLLRNSSIENLSVYAKVIIASLPLIVIGIGVAMYFDSNKGVASYDSLALGLANINGLNFATARIITDISCVLIGGFMGSRVGLVTLMTMLVTGQLTQYIGTPVVRKTIYNNIKF